MNKREKAIYKRAYKKAVKEIVELIFGTVAIMFFIVSFLVKSGIFVFY